MALLRPLLRIGLIAAGMIIPTASSADILVTYDLAHSTSSAPIAPSYAPGTSPYLTATPLAPDSRLHPGWACCQDGPGYFTFSGWLVPGEPDFTAPSLQFSITAKGAFITPLDITYQWFSGLWSDTFGSPNRVDVWGSLDNFATGRLLASHGVLETAPGAPSRDGPFVDSLTSMGPIGPGQTLSIRWIAWVDGPTWDAGAGLLNGANHFVDPQFNGTLAPIPEWPRHSLLLAGLAVLTVIRHRRRRGDR